MAEEDILHQTDVEDVIDAQVEKTVGQNQAAIEDVEPAGAVYSQAEANAAIDTINAILAVLRTSEQIETE